MIGTAAYGFGALVDEGAPHAAVGAEGAGTSSPGGWSGTSSFTAGVGTEEEVDEEEEKDVDEENEGMGSPGGGYSIGGGGGRGMESAENVEGGVEVRGAAGGG